MALQRLPVVRQEAQLPQGRSDSAAPGAEDL